MNTTFASLGSLLLVLSLASPALAQPSSRPSLSERWARTQGGRFGFEVDVLSSSHDVTVDDTTVESSRLGVTVTAVAQYKIIAGLHLDAEMPFVYGEVSGPQSTDLLGETLSGSGDYNGRFFLGNPTIGLHYAGNVLPILALFGGVSGTIPIIHDPSFGLALAAAANVPARAYFNAQRSLLEHVSLRARVGTELRLARVLFLSSDFASHIAVPTRDGSSTKVVLENGNEIEFRPFGSLGFGMRLQAAFTLSSSDGAQLAAEPFVTWEPLTRGSFARVGALVALDEPLGFGLDEGKVATIRVALGSKW